VWLIVRRLAGELQQPLGTLALIVVGVIVAIATSTLRLAWQHLGSRPSRWRSMAMCLWLLPSAAAILLACALSIAGTRAPALLLLWIILLASEGTWWLVTWQALRRPSRGEAPGGHAPATGADTCGRTEDSRTTVLDTTPHDVQPRDELVEEEDEHLPDDIDQQLTRSNSEQFGDTVTGLLRGHFRPGERSRSLHVAFCPPMKSQPSVEVIQLTGPQARVKAANIESFGVRFDLRLAASSQQQENVLIHFEARARDDQQTSVDERQV
jgi:hypothetical protein